MGEVFKFSVQTAEAPIIEAKPRSLGGKIFSWSATWAATLFGLISVVCLLAALVNIPLAQIAVLGYFLDSSAKIGRGGPLSSGFIGLKTAAKIGRWVLCAFLVLIPLRIVGLLWANAQIIDPTSQQTIGLNGLYWVIAILTTVHILSALSCGGEIRHFFWPLMAPLFVLARIAKRFRKQSDLPPKEWFVPKMIWGKLRQGTLYTQSRDDTLDFLQRLQLPHFFWLGLKGFVGSAIWLLLPTVLLTNSTHPRPGLAGLSIVLGMLIAVPVFMILPMLQIQFAADQKFGSLFDIRQAWARMRRTPLACLLALLLMLVLALPLFLLKIEKIPPELFWLLSVLFIVLGWPARFIWGWVYRYSQQRESHASRGIRWPIGILTAASALIFAFAFFLTRYTSWNGTLSLFENHVFLLPAPFWF